MAEQTDVELRIGREIAELQAHYYGRAPARVYTQVSDTIVVVILEETFSMAERTLIEREEAGGIQDIRRRFQRVQADEFKAVVENLTGRNVRSFVSDTDLKENISIEIFLLAGALEDMAAFEREIELQGSGPQEA